MKAYFTSSGPAAALYPRLVSTARAYFRLTKPRIAVLLLISTAAGMLAAGGGTVAWSTAGILLLGGYLCSGGAGAFNCYLDRELDVAMARTRRRPLPLGQLAPRNALVFSLAISLLSIPLFLMISPLVAVLGAVAWAYYVLLYSVYLKRRTHQNVVVGGAAGAFPPMIGWVAVSGSIDLSSIFLFLIVFFWTPPHAYALMMVFKEDYSKANIPMLPVVLGDRETGRQIFLYSVFLLALTALPAFLGLFGTLYLVTAVALGVIFVALSVKLYRTLEMVWAIRLFRYSTFYLAALLVGVVLDRAIAG